MFCFPESSHAVPADGVHLVVQRQLLLGNFAAIDGRPTSGHVRIAYLQRLLGKCRDGKHSQVIDVQGGGGGTIVSLTAGTGPT